VGHAPSRGDFPWADLGEAWETRNSSFKPFPCGHVIHPFIQAALFLLQTESIDVENIQAIECRVPPYAVPMVCEPASRKQSPADDTAARISLQYTIAEALSLGVLDGNSYSPSSLSNPSILALAGTVAYVADDSFASRQRYGGKLIIAMKDGRKFTRTEPYQWGSPELPIGTGDVERKFVGNVGDSQLAASPQMIVDMVSQLETLERVDALVELCCPRE
jgi:2-methylcitrate dehydratase PrpD